MQGLKRKESLFYFFCMEEVTAPEESAEEYSNPAHKLITEENGEMKCSCGVSIAKQYDHKRHCRSMEYVSQVKKNKKTK